MSIDRAGRKVALASGGRLLLATSCWPPARATACSICPMPTAGRDELSYASSTKARRCQHHVVEDAAWWSSALASLAWSSPRPRRIEGLEVDVLELAHARDGACGDAPRSLRIIFRRGIGEAGIRIHLGVQATSIEAEGGKVAGVFLERRPAPCPRDLIVVGVGVLPNIELAAEAGLSVAAGIIADEYLLTTDPDISGDRRLRAAQQARASADRRGRSRVQNATDQACCPGRAADRRQGRPTTAIPGSGATRATTSSRWRGSPPATTRVVLRGDPAKKAFSAFCYKGDRAARHRVHQSAPAIPCSAADCSAMDRTARAGAGGR